MAADMVNTVTSQAQSVLNTATELGYFSHFKQYAVEMMMPWTLFAADEQIIAAPDVKSKALVLVGKAIEEVKSTLAMTRSADVKASFIFYNVLGFWLGMSVSLVFALFGMGLVSLIWNGGISFILAYTLYWTMTCVRTKPFMFYSLCAIALYVAFNVYMGLQKLLLVLPAALYFGKALCDVLLLINGYPLYKDLLAETGDEKVML